MALDKYEMSNHERARNNVNPSLPYNTSLKFYVITSFNLYLFHIFFLKGFIEKEWIKFIGSYRGYISCCCI